MTDGVYGLTAWPPREIVSFVEAIQAKHGACAHGAPHLNLRYPFRYSGSERSLVKAAGGAAAAIKPFRAYLEGWHQFPNAIVIAIRATPEVRAAHAALLAAGGKPFQEGRDREDFFPHVTIALSNDPLVLAAVLAEKEQVELPRHWWTVDKVSLTRDEGGSLVEVAAFPFSGE